MRKQYLSVSVPALEENPLSYKLEIRATEPGFVNLHLFDFPGWTVNTLAGPTEIQQSISPNGQIRLFVPRAGSYKFTERFTSTPLRIAAGTTSLVALFLLYPVLWGLNRILFRREGLESLGKNFDVPVSQ